MAARETVIKSTNMRSMAAIIVFAVLWNIISVPIFSMLAKEFRKSEGFITVIAFILPLVGVILIILAIISVMRQIKFGESLFHMRGANGVIGGMLQGTVDTSVNIDPEDGFDLKLSCIYKYTTGSGKNRRTHEEVLWRGETKVFRELLYKDKTRSSIPVNFPIPSGGVMESESSWFSGSSVTWRLDVKAKVPGLDYKVSFEVPVKRTYDDSYSVEEMQEFAEKALAERKLVDENAEGEDFNDENPEVEEVEAEEADAKELEDEGPALESLAIPAVEWKEAKAEFIEQEAVKEKEAAPESIEDKEEFYQKLEASGIKIEQAAKTERAFIFPAFRNPGLSIVSLLLTLILAAAAVILAIGQSPAISLATIFGLFALLFFAVFIDVSLFRSRVTITKHTLILESGRFLTGNREFDLREIDKVFASGSKLFMHMNSDRKIKLAVRIPGKTIAERLANEMNKLVSDGHTK